MAMAQEARDSHQDRAQPRSPPRRYLCLERIAQDSERDHWSIMEVLCATFGIHRIAEEIPSEAKGVQMGYGSSANRYRTLALIYKLRSL